MVIVDNSGSLAPAIVRQLDGKLADGQPQFISRASGDARRVSRCGLQQELRARINAEKLDAYLWLPQNPADPPNCTCAIPDNFGLIGPLSNAVDQSVIAGRLG